MFNIYALIGASFVGASLAVTMILYADLVGIAELCG